jgi:hypothetical protein
MFQAFFVHVRLPVPLRQVPSNDGIAHSRLTGYGRDTRGMHNTTTILEYGLRLENYWVPKGSAGAIVPHKNL